MARFIVTSTGHWYWAACLAVLALIAGPLSAVGASSEIAALGPRVVVDVTLQRQIAIGGQDISLFSCRRRGLLWLDFYVSALYLPPVGIPAMGRADQAKAIRLTVLDGEYLSNKIPQRYRDTLGAYLGEDEIEALDRWFRALERGDTVWLTYSPATGISVSINDRPLLSSSNHELVEALLDTWARNDPWERKLAEAVADHRC